MTIRFARLSNLIASMVLFGTGLLTLAAACGVFLIGFGFGPIFPNMIAIGAARFPDETGRMTSIVAAGAARGGVSVPWIMGQTIAHIGAAASMTAALVVTLLMAVAAMSLGRIDHAEIIPRRSE